MPDQSTAFLSTSEGAAPATLGAALSAMTRAFARAGLDTPGLDARRLAMFALGLDAACLLRDPERQLSRHDIRRLAEVMARRLAREPVSRIEGWRSFHGLALEIDGATLDPRPDTETLVEATLDLLAGMQSPTILDIGTGSGAILVALLTELPRATGVGIDIDEAALRVAARNAARHKVHDRARFLRSNWLDQVDDRFDVVVSNPPYIPSSELADLEPEVLRHDPVGALDGGPDGYMAYRAIASRAARVLKPNGWIAVEVGAGQAETVADMLAAVLSGPHRVERRIWRDVGRINRCVAVRTRV